MFLRKEIKTRWIYNIQNGQFKICCVIFVDNSKQTHYLFNIYLPLRAHKYLDRLMLAD